MIAVGLTVGLAVDLLAVDLMGLPVIDTVDMPVVVLERCRRIRRNIRGC